MAEINKLSVGKVLDKLRRADTPKPSEKIDEKIQTIDEEIQRMRAVRLRHKSQRTGTTKHD